MTPLTHSVNVAGLAVRPAQVGVYPHPLLKISLAAVAVEMLWVPGLVQGTDTILQLCSGCSGYRAIIQLFTLRMKPLHPAHLGTNLFL